jgi:hypothetical protein
MPLKLTKAEKEARQKELDEAEIGEGEPKPPELKPGETKPAEPKPGEPKEPTRDERRTNATAQMSEETGATILATNREILKRLDGEFQMRDGSGKVRRFGLLKRKGE